MTRPTEGSSPAAALARAAAFGPYFTVRLGEGTGPTLGELYRDPARLRAEIDRTAAALGAVPARVAASTWQFACCAYLVSPALAAAAGGVVPVLDPAHTRWNPADPVRLSTTDPTALPADTASLRTALVHTHLAPLVAAVHGAVRVAEPLLWGNAASALVGAATVLGEHAPRAQLAELLATPPLAGATEGGRRRSCCLYYRVPGGGYCGDCPLG